MKKLLLSGILSSAFFLTINQPMLLIFSIFLIILHYKKPLQKINSKIKIHPIIKLIILMILIGFTTEFLAIWNVSNLTHEEIMETNKLYSSNPITDIILGWGYYVPLAIVWFLLFKKYNYSIKDTFISMGIFGIFFEGKGFILLSLNPAMWAYAFLVHGSYIAIAYTIMKKEGTFSKQKTISKTKKYLYGFLYSLLTFIPFIIWENIIKSLI